MRNSRFDVKSFLIDHNIVFISKGKNVGREDVNVKCPRCDDPSYHLGIHMHTGIFHCWRCDFSGNFITLIQTLLNVSYGKACKIANKYVISGQKFDIVEKQVSTEVVFPEESYFLVDSYDGEVEQCRVKALLYLKNRYINPKNKFMWMFTPNTNNNYKHLIIIPIVFKGEIVTWIGRRYTPEKPKYVNCPKEKSILTTKSILWNYDGYHEGDIIFLTEGIFDAIRFGRFGVATFGKIISEQQLELLYIKKPKKIYYVPDRDVEKCELTKICQQLATITEVEVLKIPQKFKDVGEMKKSDVIAWLKSSIKKSEFERVFEHLVMGGKQC